MSIKVTRTPPATPTFDITGLTQVQADKLCSLLCKVEDTDIDKVLDAISEAGVRSTVFNVVLRSTGADLRVNALRLRVWE